MENNSMKRQKMIDSLMKNSGGAVDRQSIEAAMDGNTNALLDKLNDSDKAKIQQMLNDKAALQKLLSSDAAKQIMKRMTGNKNNNG